MTPRGRRPAGSDTRRQIVDAARAEFAELGYDGVSLRAVARRAGVDPALIHHYFEGKTSLFAEVVQMPQDVEGLIADLADGPLEELGQRMALNFLELFESGDNGSETFQALLRSAVSPDASDLLSAYLETEIFGKLVDVLALVHPAEEAWELQRRIGMATSQLIGLAMLRYVVKVPVVVKVSQQELGEGLGAILQSVMLGDPM